MERTLRRISPGSVFKVSFVVYALIVAVFGCLFFVLPMLLLGGAALPFMDSDNVLGSVGAMTGGAVGVIIVYILMVVLGGLVQAIVMAIAAVIYNLVAGWVGGIRYEVQE